MKNELRLEFSGSPSTVRIPRQDPPWKVIRGFPIAGGGALVHLNNVSGGILAGDDLALDIKVAPRATAQLTSTGATRIYRSRGECARQSTTARVAGLLEYLPDAIIPFAGSRYSQRSAVDLDPGAGLFWWEVVAPGREAAGELFAYDSLAMETVIRAEGRPVAVERFRLESRPWLGKFTHFATFYICSVGEYDWLALEARLREIAPGDSHWGISALAAHGLVVRGLATRSRFLFAGLTEFWKAAKRALYGTEAVLPRKIF